MRQSKMITIGITGGVGAGKSTVLDFLEEKYQAYVIKADEIGHLVMEPGQSCYEPVLKLVQTDRRFTVFHACNSHHIYMADLIYAMRNYGFKLDIVKDEEFEEAVKEFAKNGNDSDAVSGLIAYTSHNENEIYTIDYSNRFTAQVLYRLDYKWPVTDDRYLENAIAALDRLTFFD